MFGFKRRAYRKQVEAYLISLVDFNEPYFQKLYASFGGVRSVIDTAYADNRNPLDFAVMLWGLMFTFEVERSPQLVAEGERIIEFLSKGGKHRYDTEAAMLAFITMAHTYLAFGSVKPETLENAVDEIIGALRGIPQQERTARRLGRVLEDLWTKPTDPTSD